MNTYKKPTLEKIPVDYEGCILAGSNEIPEPLHPGIIW